ncbi:MAG: hypothetical protein RIR48_2126 [Bacteroidota bacterium]|jgi:hypothetical protein
MPAIILTEPFIRHYAGSVFYVDDAIGISGWDEDDRVRDRQPCHDNRVYILPDNGKGIACELPVDYTVVCPEKLLENVNLKSGPCRITSVSEGLERQQNDPWLADPLPMGRGRLLLKNSVSCPKNMVVSDGSSHLQFTKAIIDDLLTQESKTIGYRFSDGFQLDFSDFEPGFFRVELFNDADLQHSFTLIKCFPIIVKFSGIRHKYTIAQTLW